MGLTVEEQREAIREEKRKIAHDALVRRVENKFHLSDYFVKGIYFLFHNDKVVYIGKSDKNVFKRVTDHFNDGVKIFDSFTFRRHDVSDKRLLAIEKELIKEYRPKYNITHAKPKKIKIFYGSPR